MIETISFVNESWTLPIIIAAVILLLLFIWKELPNLGQTRFYLRSISALVVIICLSLIILKPQSAQELGSNNVVLITRNHNANQLDSLENSHPKLIRLAYSENSKIIPDSLYPDSLFVIGNGVEEYDLYKLENTSVKYLNQNSAPGITKIYFKNQFKIGDELRLKGIYANPEIENQLVLKGPANTSLDSIEFKDEESLQFQLKSNLKIEGNFIYHLEERDTVGKILSSNSIPIKIQGLKPMQVLILNAFPTFETKYLKNFLAEKGNKVVSRIQLTKGLYKFEYFNLAKVPISRLAAENLNPFDLVVMDYQSLSYLSSAEKNALEQAIKEQGLGLFIQPSSATFSSNNPLIDFNFKNDYKSRTETDERTELAYSKFPYRFGKSNLSQPLHIFGTDTISTYKILGSGRIATTVLDKTYELILKGNEDDYQLLWTDILNEISKRTEIFSEWEVEKSFNYENEKLDFKLRTAIKNPEITDADGNRIALMQDVDLPNLWYGSTFPKKAGWNSFKIGQDSTQVFTTYVYNEKDWQSVRENNTRELNKVYYQNREVDAKARQALRPSNLIYLYLIVLLGLGYLWFAPKIGDTKF
ncbi:hypothetical protein SAMN03097699_0502 [Flavobacteriaceae bacterium MAR_2010_188]|nr:hypothetical protein SAMN03097699_0502 [Flavobacteriaceae bacterium MAR_2010_188]